MLDCRGTIWTLDSRRASISTATVKGGGEGEERKEPFVLVAFTFVPHSSSAAEAALRGEKTKEEEEEAADAGAGGVAL
uniref:Uncharacterized protein n=1 Tax=Leersia perrieri TaxID=77586 RepID=A0A0D9VY01_9ORYZ